MLTGEITKPLCRETDPCGHRRARLSGWPAANAQSCKQDKVNHKNASSALHSTLKIMTLNS